MGLARDLLATYRARRDRPVAGAAIATRRDVLQLLVSALLAAAAFAAFRGLGDCVGLVMAAGTLPFGETFAQAGVVCVSQRGQLGNTLLGAVLLIASGWTLLAD